VAKTQREFHTPETGWRSAIPGVVGMWEQILSHDPDRGDYTRLVRMDPGTDTGVAGVLTHDFHEEVYIVAGDLTDLTLGETFTAGMYCCRLPGMRHGPYRSEGGNLMVEFRHGFP
jgi:ChrR Cupin-like domain